MSDTMSELKLIGYWITSLNDEDFLPPQEFVLDDESPVREIVGNYLDSGDVVAAYRGLSWCRICGEFNGCCERSDGHWIWPEGLSHYVRDHNVKLPDEFIADAVAGRPTRVMPGEERANAEVNLSFWKEWCSQNRSGLLRSQLKSARIAVEQDMPRIVAEAIAEIVADDERRFGLSGSVCLWEGCANFALKDHDLCAACIARCLNKHQSAELLADITGLYKVLQITTTDTSEAQ